MIANTAQVRNAKVGARTLDYLRQFERCIELIRCKDDVVVTIKVADNLQACSSVVLVVRTEGEYDQSHAETTMFMRKISKFTVGF